MKKLFIAQSEDYKNLKRKIATLIDKAGGLEISRGDRVLLKPNLITNKHIAITHPSFTGAVGEIFMDFGCKVEIADSPGSSGDINTFKDIGYRELGFPFYLFDEYGTRRINGFPITDRIEHYDYIINLPKLKTHLLTILSIGVKNLFGFIPGKYKKMYHVIYPDSYSFSKMLFSLYRTVKTDITILDGIVGMEGEGPTNGTEIHTGIIALSNDPMVMDYGISVILNIKEFPLREIYDEHFGNMEIEIIGDNPKIPSIKLPSSSVSKLPKLGKLTKLLFHKIPRPIRENCTICYSCEESCPIKAIDIEHDNVYINYHRCIECYTCLEVCPADALEIKEYVGPLF